MSLSRFLKMSWASALSFCGVALAEIAQAAPVAPAATTHQGSPWSMLWLPAVLILVFYFLMIRPQTKRAKEHRQLVENIAVGDEIVTTGGLMGRVARLRDNFIAIEVSRGVEVMFQKNAISAVLPKGTIDAV